MWCNNENSYTNYRSHMTISCLWLLWAAYGLHDGLPHITMNCLLTSIFVSAPHNSVLKWKPCTLNQMTFTIWRKLFIYSHTSLFWCKLKIAVSSSFSSSLKIILNVLNASVVFKILPFYSMFSILSQKTKYLSLSLYCEICNI